MNFLIVIILIDILLSVVMQSVIMTSVVVLIVVILSVLAPRHCLNICDIDFLNSFIIVGFQMLSLSLILAAT